MVDSLYFFSLHSGFAYGKGLQSFTQDSSKLTSNLNCFGDQITNKDTKTYTKWLKLLSRALNMPIELKGQNYYSKVFKRINYKLSNSTFWVVISELQEVLQKWLKWLSSRMLHGWFFFASPPCIPDLLMAKDFKASILHVSELSIALPWIPKNCPQSRIALVIKLLTKTPKLTHFD